MTDQLPLGLESTRAAPASSGRGRPKGAKGKRSGDLASIIVATYGGRTPGQQLADLALVTPREVREAKAEARALGLTPSVMAQINKAKALARAMGWEGSQGLRDAWALMMKAYSELLPYIHQRLPQAEAPKIPGQLPQILLPDGPDVMAAMPLLSSGEDEEYQGLDDLRPLEVSQSKSHD